MQQPMDFPRCSGCQIRYRKGQKTTNVRNQRTANSVLPILLQCGHSMCDTCINHACRLQGEVSCAICQKRTTITKNARLMQPNLYLVGMSLETRNSTKNLFDFKLKMVPCTLSSEMTDKRTPVVCRLCGTSAHSVCRNCPNVAFCQPCLKKYHSEDKFKGHFDIISVSNPKYMKRPMCVVPGHENLLLDYYCEIEEQRFCSECIADNHSGHEFVKCEKKFKDSTLPIKKACSKMEGNLKKLQRSAKDLDSLLVKVQNIDDQCINEINQVFQQLHGILQLREANLISQVMENIEARNSTIKKKRADVEEEKDEHRLLISEAEEVLKTHGFLDCDMDDLMERLQIFEDKPCSLTPIDETKLPSKFSYSLVDFDNIGSIEMDSISELLSMCCSDKDSEIFDEATNESNCEDDLPELEFINTECEESFDSEISFQSQSSVSINGFDSTSSNRSKRVCGGGRVASKRDKKLTPRVKSAAPLEVISKLRNFNTNKVEIVRVVNVVNPDEFYVVRKSEQAALKDMCTRLSRLNPTILTTISEISKNKLYLVRFIQEEWRRIRVKSLKMEPPMIGVGNVRTTYEVFHIDFGTSSVLHSPQHFYEMPDEYRSLIPFAARCSFDGIEPPDKSKGWSPEAAKHFTTYVGDRHVRMTVFDDQRDQLIVDIGKAENNFQCPMPYSIRDTLVHLNLARLSCRSERAASINLEVFHQKYLSNGNHEVIPFYPPCAPDVGCKFQATFSWGVSPTEFYVQRVDDCFEQLFKSLMSEIQIYYRKNRSDLVALEPVIGMSSVVKYTDGSFYRAKVIEIPVPHQVKIFYVDFGNTCVINFDEVLPIHQKFMSLPEMAIRCSLADIAPKDGTGVWSEEANHYFSSSAAHNEICNFRVEAKTDDGIVVSVSTGNDGLGMNLNSLFVSEGFAMTIGPCSQKAHIKLSARMTENRPNNFPLTTADYSKDEEPATPRNEKGESIYNSEITEIVVESPSSIYFQLAYQKEEIACLMDTLQLKYINSLPIIDAEWETGIRCVVLSSEDDTWYRAVIVSVKRDLFEVLLIDFGRVCFAKSECLREIDEDHRVPDAFAKHCFLYGITAPGGQAGKWPSVATEYLTQKLKKYENKTYVKFHPSEKNQSDVDSDEVISLMSDGKIAVELIIKMETLKGALDPIITVYKFVTDLLIDEGLALPTNSFDQDIYNSYDNGISEFDDCRQHSDDNSDNDVEVNDWLPPEIHREVGFRFQANYTFFSDDGLLYVNDAKNTGLLGSINDSLKKECDPTKSLSCGSHWRPGQPCIAKCGDGWLRARIVSITYGIERPLAVEYIDYGNHGELKADEVSKDISFLDCPRLSFAYRLFNVEPIDGEKYSSFLLDDLKRKLESKVLLVTIKDSGTKETPPVIEIEYSDGVLLSDWLVDAKYARRVNRQTPIDSLLPLAQAPHEMSAKDEGDNEFVPICTPILTDLKPSYVDDPAITIGTFHPVKIIHFESPTTIHVLRVADKEEEQKAIQNTFSYSKAKKWPRIDSPVVGMFCGAKHNSHFVRAIIVELDEGLHQCTVFFVDSGKRSKMAFSKLRELPGQIIRCELHRLEPVGEVWTDIIIKKLNNLLNKNDSFFIEIKGSSDPIPVDLRVMEDDGEVGDLVYRPLIESNDLKLTE